MHRRRRPERDTNQIEAEVHTAAMREHRGRGRTETPKRRKRTPATPSAARRPPSSWASSRKTLTNWRSLGIGPPYLKYGSRLGPVRYRLADLVAWQDAHLQKPAFGGGSHA